MIEDRQKTVMTFTGRLIAQGSQEVAKLKAKDSTERWAYYVVRLKPGRETAFHRAVDGVGMIDLCTYGEVLASTYLDDTGEIPAEFIASTKAWFGIELTPLNSFGGRR
ncbi:hypothetical protein [Rhizobium sp. SL86]|uniref:hypothetical protein n=1 Tax=Rhizobium sp. SL86 TaxID=2995148 RepID=UPI0022746239|nr:hypothetical protein [Rhizobium sp. SL86]MCY1669030.1 hypothetical protein [Rhizobium sp. SL86]